MRDADRGPPAQIDIYAGGNLRWSDVNIPEGLEVSDERLEAHGFTSADGLVLEGKVLDLATKKPIPARMQLQRVEPQAKGGYHYPIVAETTADAHGRWVLKKAPAGWYRVVIEADGFVPRVAGYTQFDEQPRWRSYECGLSRPAPVSGRVTDDAGQPLADVDVQLRDVMSDVGGDAMSRRTSIRSRPTPMAAFVPTRFPSGAPRSGSPSSAIAARARVSRSRRRPKTSSS